MDVYDEDLLEFWKSLQMNNVQFIIVGDFACSIHGY